MHLFKADKEAGVLADKISKLVTFYPRKEYMEKLRRKKYYDEETDKALVFLTNDFDLAATEIAFLYSTGGKSSCFSNGESSSED